MCTRLKKRKILTVYLDLKAFANKVSQYLHKPGIEHNLINYNYNYNK